MKKIYTTSVARLNFKDLIQIYQTMLKVRFLEDEMVRRWPEQEMRSPPHFSTGREAIGASVIQALEKTDQIMGYYRGHCYYVAKGGDIKKFLAEMYCKVTGTNEGKGGSMLISAPEVGFMGASSIVAGGVPIATGIALAQKMKKDRKTIVCFTGEAATEEGVYYESLNFASLHKLPIIYVVENDSFAVTTKISKRRSNFNKLISLPKAFGIPAVSIDGNNPLVILETAQQAVKHVRSGKGPYFIEAITYRYREHVGEKFDDFTPGRSKKDLEKWMKKDPIIFLEKYLLTKKIITDNRIATIKQNINSEILAAFEYAKNSPLPKKSDLLTNVYAEDY